MKKTLKNAIRQNCTRMQKKKGDRMKVKEETPVEA